MAQLLVRNLDPALVVSLRRRALEHGVSAEEEHRRILAAALAGDSKEFNRSFADHLMSLDGRVDDFVLPERRASTHRQVKF
jgi:plasmid stability protein